VAGGVSVFELRLRGPVQAVRAGRDVARFERLVAEGRAALVGGEAVAAGNGVQLAGLMLRVTACSWRASCRGFVWQVRLIDR